MTLSFWQFQSEALVQGKAPESWSSVGVCSWAKCVRVARGSLGVVLAEGFCCVLGKSFSLSIPPPSSICIKISVKIKVCFCILQIVIQTVSRKELVIHFYIQHIYTHA